MRRLAQTISFSCSHGKIVTERIIFVQWRTPRAVRSFSSKQGDPNCGLKSLHHPSLHPQRYCALFFCSRNVYTCGVRVKRKWFTENSQRRRRSGHEMTKSPGNGGTIKKSDESQPRTNILKMSDRKAAAVFGLRKNNTRSLFRCEKK